MVFSEMAYWCIKAMRTYFFSSQPKLVSKPGLGFVRVTLDSWTHGKNYNHLSNVFSVLLQLSIPTRMRQRTLLCCY